MTNKKVEANRLNTKPDLSLIPPYALMAVARAFEAGLEYGRGNWAEGGPLSEYDAAAQRHQLLFRAGQDLDEKSGCHHLALAIADLMIAMETQALGTATDDRTRTANPLLAYPHGKRTNGIETAGSGGAT